MKVRLRRHPSPAKPIRDGAQRHLSAVRGQDAAFADTARQTVPCNQIAAQRRSAAAIRRQMLGQVVEQGGEPRPETSGALGPHKARIGQPNVSIRPVAVKGLSFRTAHGTRPVQTLGNGPKGAVRLPTRPTLGVSIAWTAGIAVPGNARRRAPYGAIAL